ncbi:MAG: diguanylate cyclase [Gammaproteobacteria bacterium]|nr:diguanylate cyclase [Gammaproteobacteria bacterium]
MTTHNASAPAPPPANGRGRLPRVRHLARRMREDMRLAIVTLYSISALVTIGPFAAFRLATGDIVVGLVDSAIVLCFLAFAALAWHPAWTRRAANVLAAVAATAAAVAVLALGLSPMWIFSTLVGNFLMAQRNVAVLVNATLVVLIALQPAIFGDGADHATFIAVAAMTSLFSLIFASRVATQRTRLSELAARDGLTGAFNRRSLDHDLAHLVDSDASGPHSLAILDLDDFKRLNDSLGHEAGDDILATLSRIARQATREKDRFYRYGGEEFVLLLPRTSLAGAEVALDNLRGEFGRAQSKTGQQVTFSAGLAELAHGETPDAWLARADRALMTAKRSGKDCLRAAATP